MKIGIVGAGIIGRLLTWRLLTIGHEISLFDQGDKSGEAGCSYAAAGMLAPLSELEKTEVLIYNMGQHALTRWSEIIRKLKQPIDFAQEGTIITAHPKEQIELTRLMDQLRYKQVGCDDAIELSPHEVNKLEPEFNQEFKAFYISNEGHLNSQQVMSALGEVIEASSVNWHSMAMIESVTPNAVQINEQDYHFDLVIDCRGLNGRQYFPDLRAVRGELIWLHAPEVNFYRPIRYFHPRYRIYIVPRRDNVYIIGATEIEAEDYSPISVRSLLELLTAAYSIHPGFAEARLLKTVVNCRPALANNLPRIIHDEGLIAINGLYRHGYLLAPIVVDEVCNYLNHGLAKLDFPELFVKREQK